MRRVVNLSESLLENYRKYFKRNSSKWISKHEFKGDQLGIIIEIEGQKYRLEGQVNDRQYLLKNSETGEYYFADAELFKTQVKTQK